MTRVFAGILAVVCVLGPTASFARGGFGHGARFAHGFSTRGEFRRNPTLLGPAIPQTPTFQSRIPAPLPPPAQPPIMNGPCSSGSCL
jgi:hypothetical protein